MVLLFASRRAAHPAKARPQAAAQRSSDATYLERLAYTSDNFFSTNRAASALLLFAVTVALVVAGGVAHWAAHGGEKSLLSSMWSAWRHVTDGGDYDDDVAPRVVGVVLVLSGMLFFALLVGLIGESIESRIDALKQGRNRVIEANHTLILGWSDKILPLCREIAAANSSEGGGVIVILDGAHEKAWMDETVLEELSAAEMRGTEVVCRSGDPVCVNDLHKVSAATARSIVFLANCAPLPER